MTRKQGRPFGRATGRRRGAWPEQLNRRFEACVFDWDGTAVANRDADGIRAGVLFGELLEAGFDLAVITGTKLDHIERQLGLRPRGPGRMLVCCNRGSEVFELGPDGPVLLERRVATDQEEAKLTAAAAFLQARLAERGLETGVVSDRLNRRKVDLIPLAQWAEPPKSELPELLAAVEARLGAAGFCGGLPETVELALDCCAQAGLADARVTSDAKHLELGLTDKTHAAGYVFEWLRRRGLRPEQVLIAGDELGPLGGCAGSDSRLLIPASNGAVSFSVGPEPNGVPAGVLHMPGGPARFLELLSSQLARRRAGELPVFSDDPGWQISLDGEGGPEEALRETLLALGDGRYGSRGATLQAGPDAGVRAGGRYAGHGADEELLACPAWNRIAGAASQRYRRVLDLRTGTLRHQLHGPQGHLEALLFSSFDQPGTTCLRAHADKRSLLSGPALTLPAQHGTRSRLDRRGPLTIAESWNVERVVVAATESRRTRTLDRLACYAGDEETALQALRGARGHGFERLYTSQRARWGERWDECQITIPGDPELERAVRFSMFGLMAGAAEDGETAVGARGLSGPAYRGHVFWDTEVYTLPFFAATHPATAKAMLRYRLNRLEAARANAADCRRRGARFPWESTRSGSDVTPPLSRQADGTVVPIRTGSHEEHIAADVAWAAECYLSWSGDTGFLPEARALFVETARYWASRIRLDRKGCGHIYGVIGPDEYHEPVDDSAYTNVMARWNLRRGVRAAQELPGEDVPVAEQNEWLAFADCIVDGYDSKTGVYEEFAGYYGLEPLLAAELAERPFNADQVVGFQRMKNSQLVKQADVLLLHQLVPDEVAPGSLEANLDYYEPRTSHGSSLSPAMHALLLARVGRLEQAESYLKTAAAFDLEDRNGTSGAGQHTATQGSVWQALAFGFAGLRPAGDCLEIDPHLPGNWQTLGLTVRFRDARVTLQLEPGRVLASAETATLLRLAGHEPVLVDATPVAL
ncbi:MAG: glycosyl hydrolase family 65 protein [Gaiellaceae bacterium]